MNFYRADLHVHTALSPCAADEMTPPNIVQAALDAGLAMVAICDHNSAGNAAAVQEAAAGRLCVVAGMEIATSEEVHLVGLFPDARRAAAAAAEVARGLPEIDEQYTRIFGEQWLLDASGAVLGEERRMLANASSFSLNEAVRLVHRHEGLAVAAHVNRPSFSVTSQLGMIPADADFDALEVFARPGQPSPTRQYRSYGRPVLTSSDSHYPGDVGSIFTTLALERPSFAELSLAVSGRDGRRVCDA